MTRALLGMSLPLLLLGCQGGSWATGHEMLSKPHEAVGGITLTGEGGGDWHINRCDMASDGAVLLSGGDMSRPSDVALNSTSRRNLLRVALKEPRSATVDVSGVTPVTFVAKDCDVLSVRRKRDVQVLTIDCNSNGRDLRGAVRMLGCGG